MKSARGFCCLQLKKDPVWYTKPRDILLLWVKGHCKIYRAKKIQWDPTSKSGNQSERPDKMLLSISEVISYKERQDDCISMPF